MESNKIGESFRQFAFLENVVPPTPVHGKIWPIFRRTNHITTDMQRNWPNPGAIRYDAALGGIGQVSGQNKQKMKECEKIETRTRRRTEQHLSVSINHSSHRQAVQGKKTKHTGGQAEKD